MNAIIYNKYLSNKNLNKSVELKNKIVNFEIEYA